ncbi:hypothetical protein F4677DRAFT_332983 [Hypoxylon crocopeplum]|nr:hypothetical protein F4677DRAFT_332983 [Hypoxylon crocopeplum]
MFQPHPEDRLHLRLHRARSVVLTSQELVEIRAAQRTFEGAYMRTALSQFSFALIILKIFTSEFYAIGALFAVYGAAVLVCAIYRRYQGNRQFFTTRDNNGEYRRLYRLDRPDVAIGGLKKRNGTSLSLAGCVEFRLQRAVYLSFMSYL